MQIEHLPLSHPCQHNCHRSFLAFYMFHCFARLTFSWFIVSSELREATQRPCDMYVFICKNMEVITKTVLFVQAIWADLFMYSCLSLLDQYEGEVNRAKGQLIQFKAECLLWPKKDKKKLHKMITSWIKPPNGDWLCGMCHFIYCVLF